MAPEKIQRSTAKIVKISDILNSKYVKQEGYAPNHIILNSEQVSRINIIGTVVSYGDEKSISVDDSSASIIVREFDTNLIRNANVGETVLVVGKIKEFNNEKYVAPEIIRKIDFRWLKYRALELGIKKEARLQKEESKADPSLIQKIANNSAPKVSQKMPTTAPFVVEKKIPEPQKIVEEEVVDIVESAEDEIIAFIRKNDSGEGVDIDKILESIKVNETKVENLLKSGDIFLVKPGKVKVLE